MLMRTTEKGSAICVSPDVLLALLNELGRFRALHDHETDLVELIVCRGHRSAGLRVRWNSSMDRRLLKAATKRGGIALFAKQNDISPNAAHTRLKVLRKDKATMSVRSCEGGKL